MRANQFLTFLLIPFLLPLLAGCQPNTEPIERATNTIVKEVVQPAVSKLTAELSSRSAQLQGQGSLINPGYTVRGHAGFGPTAHWEFTIQAEGVSANIAGATQADAGQAGTVEPPANREKPNGVQPAKTEPETKPE